MLRLAAVSPVPALSAVSSLSSLPSLSAVPAKPAVSMPGARPSMSADAVRNAPETPLPFQLKLFQQQPIEFEQQFVEPFAS